MKLKINNLCSAGIIYRASNPTQVFIEVKDNTYPLVAFRKHLCPIGGNWIGSSAKKDRSPLDTFKREIREELDLIKTSARNLELRLLDIERKIKTRQIYRKRASIKGGDREVLKEIKDFIIKNINPFGDFLITIPKLLMRRDDHGYLYDKTFFICSYFSVALTEDIWQKLSALQKKFGNLSNESVTFITSADEIVKNRLKTAFGHDRVLKEFFLAQGLMGLKSFPVIKNIKTKFLGLSLRSYQEYLAKYEVIKNPLKLTDSRKVDSI